MILLANREKNKAERIIKNKFAEVMFLDYVSCFGKKRKSLMQPSYFQDELGIYDIRVYEKKALKSGDIIRDENGYLEVTEKGCRFVDQNEDYVRFFESAIPYVTINEYHEQKERMADEPYEKVMIALLGDKIKHAVNSGEYQKASDLYYERGKLYRKLSRSDQAMEDYLTALYIQTSGYEYAGIIDRRKRGINTQKNAEAAYAGIYLDPHLILSIEKAGYAYEDRIVEKVYTNKHIVSYLCSVNDFKSFAGDIVCCCMDFEKWWGHFHTKYNECIEQASIR